MAYDTTLAEWDEFWYSPFVPQREELEQRVSEIVARLKGRKTPLERAKLLPVEEPILEKVLDRLREEHGSIPEIDMTKLIYQQGIVINLYAERYPDAFQEPKSD